MPWPHCPGLLKLQAPSRLQRVVLTQCPCLKNSQEAQQAVPIMESPFSRRAEPHKAPSTTGAIMPQRSVWSRLADGSWPFLPWLFLPDSGLLHACGHLLLTRQHGALLWAPPTARHRSSACSLNESQELVVPWEWTPLTLEGGRPGMGSPAQAQSWRHSHPTTLCAHCLRPPAAPGGR